MILRKVYPNVNSGDTVTVIEILIPSLEMENMSLRLKKGDAKKVGAKTFQIDGVRYYQEQQGQFVSAGVACSFCYVVPVGQSVEASIDLAREYLKKRTRGIINRLKDKAETLTCALGDIDALDVTLPVSEG